MHSVNPQAITTSSLSVSAQGNTFLRVLVWDQSGRDEVLLKLNSVIPIYKDEIICDPDARGETDTNEFASACIIHSCRRKRLLNYE